MAYKKGALGAPTLAVESPARKQRKNASRSAQERRWARKSSDVTVRRVDPELMKDGWPEVGEGEIVEVVKARKPRKRRSSRRKVYRQKVEAVRPADSVERDHWDALRRERAEAARKAGAQRVEPDWKPFLMQGEAEKFGGYMAKQSAKRRAAEAA